MLEREYIELGGKAEDYTEANDVYMNINGLWWHRHSFWTVWAAAGKTKAAAGWKWLASKMDKVEAMHKACGKLFGKREIVQRMTAARVEQLKERENLLKAALEKAKAERKALEDIAAAVK